MRDRYNTFYVLYPIGITSECTLIYQALGPAAGIDPLFQYFLIAVLVIYVPGRFQCSSAGCNERGLLLTLFIQVPMCCTHI